MDRQVDIHLVGRKRQVDRSLVGRKKAAQQDSSGRSVIQSREQGDPSPSPPIFVGDSEISVHMRSQANDIWGHTFEWMDLEILLSSVLVWKRS